MRIVLDTTRHHSSELSGYTRTLDIPEGWTPEGYALAYAIETEMGCEPLAPDPVEQALALAKKIGESCLTIIMDPRRRPRRFRQNRPLVPNQGRTHRQEAR
jgi:hypothetical protein